MTLKRLLCPTDFSAASEGALEYALALAKQVGGEVRLLHTYSLPTYYAFPEVALIPSEEYALRCSTAGQEKLDALQARHGQKGVTVETALLVGPAATEIARDADLHAADAIVMASRGHGQLANLVLGSVTERVLRIAPCPVIVVPPGAADAAGSAPSGEEA